MAANNIASFAFRREGHLTDLAGDYKIWDKTILNSATAGFDWEISNDGGLFDAWQIEGYYQYGDSKRTAYQNGLRVDRIYAALDAVKDKRGQHRLPRVAQSPPRAAAFPGCRPLNLFGRGNASTAAVDYVIGYEPGQAITTPLFFANGGYTGEQDSYVSEAAKINIMRMKQHIFELSVNGELFRGLGGRGRSPLPLAAPTARRPSTRSCAIPATSPATIRLVPAARRIPARRRRRRRHGACAACRPVGDCANTVFIQFSKVSNITGSITVKEAFGEMLIPVIARTPFFEELSVNLAGRWARYTGSGDIWAYKGGVNWTVGAGFRLRGTYSRDVRAANLSERFDVTGGAATVNDPKYNNVSTFITRYSGGNPNVKPELGDTLTAGAVYQPEFLSRLFGLARLVQHQDQGRDRQVGTQNVVNNCFNGQTSYCSLVTRDPVTDALTLVGDVFVNINQSKVEGVDLEASLRRPLRLLGGDESFSARGFASWLLERSETGSTGVKTDRGGPDRHRAVDRRRLSLPELQAHQQRHLL